LLREEEGIAARVLESLNITVEEVRAQVVRIVGVGDEPVTGGMIPFTPRAKRVLELSLREALSMGHGHIGTEHVLLGIVSENEGVAARILLDFDADTEKIRNEVVRMLSRQGAVHAKADEGYIEVRHTPAGEPGLEPSPELQRPQQSIRGRLPELELPRRRRPELLLVVGWLLFGVALAIGILIGWAIWGI